MPGDEPSGGAANNGGCGSELSPAERMLEFLLGCKGVQPVLLRPRPQLVIRRNDEEDGDV